MTLGLALGARVAHADDTADIKKFLDFFDKAADIAVKDQDVCPKMGTDLTAHVDANKDVIDTAKKAVAAGKKLPPDALKHVQDTGIRMAPAVAKCHDNKDVQTAIQRMSVGRPPARQ
ncbi:MAG TPA: hypothetical protein VMJ10_35400 [Kofleriaceae bacterium]|nr:hypothetical protein [Kofleriaceae bacterium]